MRGSIDGLGSSAPIGAMLPAVFADDDLAQRFVGGLDDVVAPILNALDCLDSYFTPSLAPLDFTTWLGGWVGAEIDGTEPEDRLRAAVAAAAYLHRVRGTVRGLSEAVRLAFGVIPEITESGAADWHARPLGPVPGDRRPICTSPCGCPTRRPRTNTGWTASWPQPAPPTCPTRSR